MVSACTLSAHFSTILSTICVNGGRTTMTCAQVGFACVIRQAVTQAAFVTHPSPKRNCWSYSADGASLRTPTGTGRGWEPPRNSSRKISYANPYEHKDSQAQTKSRDDGSPLVRWCCGGTRAIGAVPVAARSCIDSATNAALAEGDARFKLISVRRIRQQRHCTALHWRQCRLFFMNTVVGDSNCTACGHFGCRRSFGISIHPVNLSC